MDGHVREAVQHLRRERHGRSRRRAGCAGGEGCRRARPQGHLQRRQGFGQQRAGDDTRAPSGIVDSFFMPIPRRACAFFIYGLSPLHPTLFGSVAQIVFHQYCRWCSLFLTAVQYLCRSLFPCCNRSLLPRHYSDSTAVWIVTVLCFSMTAVVSNAAEICGLWRFEIGGACRTGTLSEVCVVDSWLAATLTCVMYLPIF